MSFAIVLMTFLHLLDLRNSRKNEVILPYPDAAIRHFALLEAHLLPNRWVSLLEYVGNKRFLRCEHRVRSKERRVRGIQGCSKTKTIVWVISSRRKIVHERTRHIQER